MFVSRAANCLCITRVARALHFLQVLGFQLNARKAPFVDLKRIAQAAPRPASIVVFTRSNLVRFAIALWRDRLAKDKSR